MSSMQLNEDDDGAINYPYLSALLSRIDDIFPQIEMRMVEDTADSTLFDTLDFENTKFFIPAAEYSSSTTALFSTELSDIPGICRILRQTMSFNGPIFILESLADIFPTV